MGAHNFLKIDNTATGSVAEMIDQNKNVTRYGTSNQINFKIKFNQTHINNVDMRKLITESQKIGILSWNIFL